MKLSPILIKPRILIPRASLSPCSLSRAEGDHFHYFRTVCATTFSGYFHDSIWETLILQISYLEPCIRHAAIAIGALHRSQVHPTHAVADAGEGSNTRYAVTKYLEAVKTLNQRLDSSARSMELALFASILFMVFEVLQGNDIVGRMHLKGGLGIIQSLHRQSIHVCPNSTQSTVIHGRQLTELGVLTNAFLRLDVQASNAALVYSVEGIKPLHCPNIFGSVLEARNSLNSILAAAQQDFQSYGHSYKTLPYSPLPSDLAAKVNRYQSLLACWLDAFTAFKAKPEEKLPSPLPPIAKQRHATTVLSIQHTVAWIELSTYFCRDQTSYDFFVHHFQQIIVLAEVVVGNGDNDLNMSASSIPTDPLPPFTVDMAIIQPLFFTACKCRDGSLRRRAIQVLMRAGREGVYNGKIMAAAARWVVWQEEEGFELHMANVTTELVPEEKRLWAQGLSIDRPRNSVMVSSPRRSRDWKWEYLCGIVNWLDPSDNGSAILSNDDERALESWAAQYKSLYETTLQ